MDDIEELIERLIDEGSMTSDEARVTAKSLSSGEFQKVLEEVEGAERKKLQ